MIHDFKTELRDQSAHFAASFVAVAPLLAWPSIWAAGFAGFALGLSREIGEKQPPVTLSKFREVFADQKFDLTVWTLAAMFAALVIGV